MVQVINGILFKLATSPVSVPFPGHVFPISHENRELCGPSMHITSWLKEIFSIVSDAPHLLPITLAGSVSTRMKPFFQKW